MGKKPDKWAILIGVNRYHESLGPLKYAVNDCRRVAEVLTQGQDGFPSDHVLLITDDQAEDHRPTYANVHSWLAAWLSQPKENDTVFVYFSGHGREMAGKCYLAPGDATLQTMHVTGIPVAHVQDILARCKAKQKILVLDACHSGAGKDVAAMSGSMLDQIAAGKGIYTITSCDADELSHEWDEKKQGVFSYYLAEALSGACPPDAQGRVTAESLYEWVYDRVRSWAACKRCTQNPKRFVEGTGTLVVWESAGAMRPPMERQAHQKNTSESHIHDAKVVTHSTGARALSLDEWLESEEKAKRYTPGQVYGAWAWVPVVCSLPILAPIAFSVGERNAGAGWMVVGGWATIAAFLIATAARKARRKWLCLYSLAQAELLLSGGDVEGAWAFIASCSPPLSEVGRCLQIAASLIRTADADGKHALKDDIGKWRAGVMAKGGKS